MCCGASVSTVSNERRRWRSIKQHPPPAFWLDVALQKDLALTLWKEKKTALLITHDLTEAIILSDRVLVMSKRPGTLIKELKIDIPNRELPFERREHPKVVHYVRELIELLHIEEDDMLPA